MQCHECRTLLDIPETAREVGEQARLEAHLEQCATCRALADRMRGAMRALRFGPTPLPGPAFLERLNARLEADRQASRAAAGLELEGLAKGDDSNSLVTPVPAVDPAPLPAGSPLAGEERSDDGDTPRRRSAATPIPFPSPVPAARPRAGVVRHLSRWVPALAAAVLLFWLFRPDSGDPVRFKGVPVEARLELRMQGTIERAGGGLEPLSNPAPLRPGDGLVLRFDPTGGRYLWLLEVTPRGQAGLLYEWTHLDRRPAPRPLEMLDADGRPLRYVPEAGPGEYTLVALLSDTALEEDQLRALATAQATGGGAAVGESAVLRVNLEPYGGGGGDTP